MSTFSDIMLTIRLALAYGPTIRAGIKAANESPEIVAAIVAFEAALKEFHKNRITPARIKPPLSVADAADDLATPTEVHLGPVPEGPGNPQI